MKIRNRKRSSAQPPQTRKARLWANFKGLASTVVFVWLFTNHVAQATIVPTESMVPTILVGDHFFLDRLGFPASVPEAVQKFLPERTIHRGDIVAFWSPEDPNRRLVKRVIGLPGDKIELRSGDVYINGEKLSEAYAVHVLAPEQRVADNMEPVTLPADRLFMMGDNRDNSRDSRFFGSVSRKTVLGKPMFVYWSYESDPYRESEQTLTQQVQHYASVATHFLTRTRWSRTGTVLR